MLMSHDLAQEQALVLELMPGLVLDQAEQRRPQVRPEDSLSPLYFAWKISVLQALF
jgi:hypothetical protein